MSTLYEYYNTNDDWRQIIAASTTLGAQTFTPSITHVIESVKLKLYRVGSPGTITVTIRTTSAGEPTSTILITGTTDGDTLTTSTSGEWREITFSKSLNFAAGTQYAIVIGAAGADTSNRIVWRNHTAGTYTGGNKLSSLDSGGSWTTSATYDFMFEDWGFVFAPPTDIVTIKRLVAAVGDTIYYEDV